MERVRHLYDLQKNVVIVCGEGFVNEHGRQRRPHWRGGRPIRFDRFYAALLGSKAVELLAEGRNNAVSVLQYHADKGFQVAGYDAHRFRDRWGLIHPRQMHPALYDPVAMKPSKMSVNYLLPTFSDARYDEALT